MTTTAATHEHDSNRAPLVLQEISVLRAPGISPGFTISDLSPDITIVFGPNASGKSTTARAIQAILWPHQSALKGHHLAATLSLGGESWQIEASAGKVERTQNGQRSDGPAIAPLDDRGRYTLGLPELLASENQPLAQAILNESSGGFDLPQVAEQLGFNGTIPARLEAAHKVRAASDAHSQAKAAGAEVADQISGRSQLLAQREKSLAAERELAAIDIAREYQRHLLDESDIQQEIDGFPDDVRNVSGDEQQRLADLAHRISEQNEIIAETNRQLDRWQHTLDQTGLAEIENPGDQIQSLERLGQQQAEIDGLLANADRDIAAAISERTAHQKRLAADLNDDQIASLDADGMREFAEIAASFESIRSRRTARDEVELWLGGVSAPENLDALKQGVETLQTRLQYPNATEQRETFGKPRWVGIGGGILVAAAGVVLAITQHPLWWLLAVLGAILAVLAWRFTSSSAPRVAAELESTYAALPLPQPEQWRAHHVRDLLGQLREELKIGLVEQEKADRWQDLEQERLELDQAYAETDTRRKNAIAKYGVAPDLKEESLRLLAENLGRWQAADASLRGIEGRRNRMKADRAALQSKSDEILATLGYTSGDIATHLDDLRRRATTHSQAYAERDSVRNVLEDTLEPARHRLESERHAIYSTIGLEPGDAEGLARLLQQRSQLLAAQENLTNRKSESRAIWDSLNLTPHLREMDVEQLDVASNAARQLADQRNEIEGQLAELDRLERSATRSDTQERAQSDLEAAKQQLRGERDRVVKNVVGDLLLTSVQQETRDAALPIVFHRARELFAIITRGKYELQFEAGPPPEFTALDTGTGMTLTLDQLSSGTRVQLLMAIRLAFVENVEVGPKLPVILDETLGNSDEFRASAIIDAAIDISRHGRQVFYFTAQGEEVSRWLQRVDSLPEDERPQVKVIELAEIRREAGFDRLPIPPQSVLEQKAIPSPTDYDADTWAAALRVPAIDPWATTTGSTHLWHLISDTEVLHALLQNDVSTLGQLTSLERTNPEQLELIHPNLSDQLPSLHSRANLLENAINMWRIGKARPMPVGILADAEMIDAPALDEMQQLQQQSGNIGSELLDQLQRMDDPPLAEKPLEAFELWMISEGYIAQGSPMSDADIRARLIELGSPAIRSGQISAEEIEALLAQTRLW